MYVVTLEPLEEDGGAQHNDTESVDTPSQRKGCSQFRQGKAMRAGEFACSPTAFDNIKGERLMKIVTQGVDLAI